MSLPVPSPPAVDPPTTALPSIPPSKQQTPSRLRTPSRPSLLPTSQPTQSTPDLPTIRSPSIGGRTNVIPAGKSVRRVISIGAFPQPPTVISRPATACSMTSTTSLKKRVSDASTTGPTNSLSKSKRLPRISTASSGSGRSMSQSAGNRMSDAPSSVHSPPQSRSSSANGSYSTSATTFEDADDDTRGRAKDVEEAPLENKRNSKVKETKGNVIVSVRVRPDISPQDSEQAEGEWMVDGRRALIAYRGREGGDYHYDNVFGTYDDNAKVYDASAKRLVRRVMEGFHGTVFAYGMTGTGKTFSMQGTMQSPGIIPLAITDIFSYIRETPHREFLLRVSYLEIYNEKIHDLLATSVGGATTTAPQEEIKLREDSKRGVYATPLKEEIVQSPNQLLRVIHRGDMARRTSSTQYNARSSRSHAVVQIVVESRERVSGNGSLQENKRIAMLPGGVRVSTLSLIDLAGSERAADDKERRTEGAHINKSLLTLGTVIGKLSGHKDKNGNPTDKEGKHLPYRDSKLTRLLQPALSGNSLVSILCTIQISFHGSTAVGSNHTGETMNTLKFALRAKNNIISHAKRATEEVGTGVNAGLLERYRAEISNLRSQLDSQQKTSIDKEEKQMEKEAEQRHEEQMLEMQLARTALKERIEHLNRLILCSKSTGVNSGTVSALGMHSRLSTSTTTDLGGSRSVRSSASQSTLGVTPGFPRHPSMQSLVGGIGASGTLAYAGMGEDDEDAGGEYGDGMASLQAQNRALQSDLQDKNRYIATLEKRLLQARRSSHSRASLGFNRSGIEENDMIREITEKDAMISDLQKTVAALRSAFRKREIAEQPPEIFSTELTTPRRRVSDQSRRDVRSSNHLPSRESVDGTRSPPSTISPIVLLSPRKSPDKKRRSVDEMSKMLDEMIQDKVESGHLIKSQTGSVRVAPKGVPARQPEQPASVDIPAASGPAMAAMIASLRVRDSVVETENAN